MEFLNTYGWLCLIAILLIAEAMTTNFVTIWFAIGALVALLASFAVPNPAAQMAIFIVVSAILVIATLPLVRKMRNKKKMPLNAERNIGRIAKVVQALEPGEQGRVRLDGVDWAATSAYPIAQGEACRVCAITSTVLTVEPVPQTANA